MRKTAALLLIFVLILALCGCADEQNSPSPTPSREVEVLRLDTPTPAPTPEQEVAVVFDSFEHAATFVDYSQRYVEPALALRQVWSDPEELSADELGRFFIALGDERRGFSITEYLADGEYRVPSDRFCGAVEQFLELDAEYLTGLENYSTSDGCFVLPGSADVERYAEVYRIEEVGGEIRIRYILYTSATDGCFESTGGRYELLLQRGEQTERYVGSAQMTDDTPVPAPQDGERYSDEELESLYARRGLEVESAADVGGASIVEFGGTWSGLELFDRESGAIEPVVCFVRDENAREMLVSPPFDAFSSARLAAYSLEKDGSVRLLVQNLATEADGALFSRVYTLRDGAFGYEPYSAPLAATASVGAGGRGSLYAIIPGSGERIAFLFGSESTDLPRVSVTGTTGALTVRMSGTTLPDGFEPPAVSSPYYSVASISAQDGDVFFTIALSSEVNRYRLYVRDPVAGSLPYVELELVIDSPDYPAGW